MRIFQCFLLTLLAVFGSFTIVAGQQTDPAVPEIFYRLPGQEKARARKDIIYKKTGDAELKLDIYAPEKDAKTLLPAVFFVSGASDTKHWNIYRNYGELTAVSGMIAVNFNKRFPPGDAGYATGLEDTLDAIKFIRESAAKYGIDKDRIAVWTFSAGGALTIAGLQENQPHVKAVVSYYGMIGPGSRRALTLLGEKTPPVLVVRSGRDSPFINNAVDLFVQSAIEKNAELKFINYPNGQHAFEVRDNTEQTREILRTTLDFLRKKLQVK